MLEPQTTHNRLEEMERCRDWSGDSEEDEKKFGMIPGEYLAELSNREAAFEVVQLGELIEIGCRVYLSDDQLVGLVSHILLSPAGPISYLAVRTSRLFGRHKLVPVGLVAAYAPTRITLSITREEFRDLAGYRTDFAISEDADRALWKDVILRNSDYHQIGLRVKDGFVTLNGHVISNMNQWRVETAIQTVSGVVGFKSLLISDEILILEVAGALGVIEQEEDCKFFTKIENGLAVIMGNVNNTAVRDRAEQCVADIPEVRGVINDIHAPGVVWSEREQVFLQPVIGKELLFQDDVSVMVKKVVINPHNRRVIAVVAFGRFANLQPADHQLVREDPVQERLVVIPVQAILNLSPGGGFLGISSTQTSEYQRYNLSHFILPQANWLPPYPYCSAEVLFLADL